MKIETDLVKIKALASEKNDENWAFRSFLKANCTKNNYDKIIHRLTAEVSAQIDCAKCGNCCRELGTTLDQDDIDILAPALGISAPQFIGQYLTPQGKGYALIPPCPFLKDNQCQHYACCPKTCQSFPHLHKPERIFSLMQIVSNYGICPIIFNVYERLKHELSDLPHCNN